MCVRNVIAIHASNFIVCHIVMVLSTLGAYYDHLHHVTFLLIYLLYLIWSNHPLYGLGGSWIDKLPL